jgi:DNA-binding response OmpR family regulator
MITGFPSLESGVKALDEGADAYLVKPVKPEELLMLIEEKLRNKE